MTTLIRAIDPLLQPYKIKHLTLKNRIMSTSHEPNYSEDGFPKDRYRLYHVEKAKAEFETYESFAAFGNVHSTTRTQQNAPAKKQPQAEAKFTDTRIVRGVSVKTRLSTAAAGTSGTRPSARAWGCR